MNKQTPLPPAQLWIGNHDHLVQKVTTFLQKQFCPHNGCSNCSTCTTIGQQQHHAALWLTPTRGYTLEQISGISSTIAFKLEEEHHHFFIIQHADLLPPICSNSLLKSVEEPPAGYHFIFLAERHSSLLPTLVSRCVVTSFYSAAEHTAHPMFPLFSTYKPINAGLFLKELDRIKPNEQETVALVDHLLAHWMVEYKKAYTAKNTQEIAQAERMVVVFKKALAHTPMPGGSKIFLRTIFLWFNNAMRAD
jgi:DNA polymerase III delta prime subunit